MIHQANMNMDGNALLEHTGEELHWLPDTPKNK